MMKRLLMANFILVWLIFFLPGTGIGLPDYSLADTVRINQSIELSHQFYEDFNNDSSLYYASKALELSGHLLRSESFESDEKLFSKIKALKAQSYVAFARAISATNLQAAEDSLMAGLNLIGETGTISAKAALYSGLGSIYDRKGLNEKSLEYYKNAVEWYHKSGEQENYLGQLINLGIVLRVMGNYGESLEYLMEALKTGRQIGDTSAIVESLLAMGFIYAFVERYDDALRHQQEALGIYQQANDLWGIARIHNDMGVTYNLAGKLDSALVQHRAALKIRLKSTDTYNTFASYLYIGDIFADKGNFSKAVEYYESAIPYGNNATYKTMVVDAHLRLGKYCLELPDKEKSLMHLNNALQLSRQIGDPTGRSRAAMELAKISLEMDEPANAVAMLTIAETHAPEATLRFRKEIYKDMAEAWYLLGDYKSAYLNSLIYSALKDSVSAAENLGKITRLTNVLEFENELALKKESNEKMIAIKEAQINRERFTRNIFLSGMILAVVLVVIIFIRFIEKKKLSSKLNETLGNLRATQKQLIHAEKMASLGELTAGIAHEIQNPLNFVNNFSEVSNELIMEVEEERAKNQESRNEKLVSEILTDIKQNLEKINHHGKRADAIVKGMLQHSRTNTGQKEPTDINALADEYLRLSYHGLRAKDKTFNAMFETDFDPNLPKVEVVPQDIGRVLLNLINNAFYACAERSRSTVSEKNLTGLEESYKPTVTVSTKNLGDRVEISVKDNGNGIPEKIKNKIFQPFFTTKPTGQGTGLGLSLSYDIIKAHGGELSVRTPLEKAETKAAEGTEFIIILPKLPIK
jgi:two-component system, NtrC family, sensor kinase